MCSKLVKLTFIAVLISFESSNAISPMQYCERLHARRPANVTTSSEVLNVSSSSSTIPGILNSTASMNVVTKEFKYCKNGVFKYRTEVIQMPITQVNGSSCFQETCTNWDRLDPNDPNSVTCTGTRTTNVCPAATRFCLDGNGCLNGAVVDPNVQ